MACHTLFDIRSMRRAVRDWNIHPNKRNHVRSEQCDRPCEQACGVQTFRKRLHMGGRNRRYYHNAWSCLSRNRRIEKNFTGCRKNRSGDGCNIRVFGSFRPYHERNPYSYSICHNFQERFRLASRRRRRIGLDI